MSSVQKNSSYLNSKSTTGTVTRVRDTGCSSGMCPLCIDECPVLCEISMAAFRGRETLYPDPFKFGHSTAAALKDYRLDWSDFQIHTSLRGKSNPVLDSDAMLFPNVSVESGVGGILCRVPLIIGAYGSTEVASRYWRELAVGAAMTGVPLIVGENVCGVDSESRMTSGKVTASPEMERRVHDFREFWDGKYGEIGVQTNVEDENLGVDEYVISKLEVNLIERKWGQGAKGIGGEIRTGDLNKAQLLKKRGYIVIPDPEESKVQEEFKREVFHSFERHSRVGVIDEAFFLEGIDRLKDQGVKTVGLKTGAYRPSDTAFALKLASKGEIDYVVFDGSEGGTGMSPVPMMDESGVPTVYLEAWVLKCAQILEKRGWHVPDIAMAGGFIEESQVFKAIALSNFGKGPYVKSVLMGRSPITAVMKANYYVKLAEENRLPSNFSNRYGNEPPRFFVKASELRGRYGSQFSNIPWGAVGLYTYLNDRVKVGLQQLMAAARKWRLDTIGRTDLMALTKRAFEATGIPLPETCDEEEVERILDA